MWLISNAAQKRRNLTQVRLGWIEMNRQGSVNEVNPALRDAWVHLLKMFQEPNAGCTMHLWQVPFDHCMICTAELEQFQCGIGIIQEGKFLYFISRNGCLASKGLIVVIGT